MVGLEDSAHPTRPVPSSRKTIVYKALLCWRYLRTRYIALVCIISVTLGVATMIVVNSVMAGFTHEMNVRLNGMLGDLVFEARSMDGAPDAEFHMARMRQVAGDDIVGMSPTVHVPSLLYLDVNGQLLTRQVTLVGIDEATYASVSQFGDYLVATIKDRGVFGVGARAELTWHVSGSGHMSSPPDSDVASTSLAVQTRYGEPDVVFSVADGTVRTPPLPAETRSRQAVTYPGRFAYELLRGQRTSAGIAFYDNDGNPVVVIVNFAGIPHEGYKVGVPRSGAWDEVLNTDSSLYGGSGVGNLGRVEASAKGWKGQPASTTLRLPPLGAVVLRPAQ